MKLINNNDLEYIISNLQLILDNYWNDSIIYYSSWSVYDLIDSFNLDLNIYKWKYDVPTEYIEAFKTISLSQLRKIKKQIQLFKNKYNI
jgi:hypothetical protein